jgi:hypothetical protein
MDQTPFTAEDIQAHREHDHIAAVFASRDDAEAAVTDLRRLGLGSEHLGVAFRGAEHLAFEHDESAGPTRHHDGRRRRCRWIPGRVALFAAAIPVIGVIGVGGIPVAGAAPGLGGAMFWRLHVAAGNRALDEHDDIGHTPLNQGEVLVAVCSHGHLTRS